MSELEVGLAYNLSQVNRFAAAPAERLHLCSAYVSQDGMTAIKPLLQAADFTDAVFGYGPRTDPAALRALCARPAVIRLFPHSPQSEFHPKCYFGLCGDGSAWAAVGSANLTGRGADGNVELLVTAAGPRDHAFFTHLTDWFHEVRSFALALTPQMLGALERAYGAYAAVAAAQEPYDQLAAALESSAALAAARDFARRLHQQALLRYIQTTRLFASYKLVIMALLLHTPDGRLRLSDCARRFHAFYLELEAAGVQPERSTGHPAPRMLTPRQYRMADVERLLLEAPREAFLRSGSVILYREESHETCIYVARSLWSATSPASRQATAQALVERLEEYYQHHVGTSRGVRAALLAAVR